MKQRIECPFCDGMASMQKEARELIYRKEPFQIIAHFYHYKNYGASISGLSYRAIQYGPVPANYDNIYAYLENEQIIRSEWVRLSNGSAREVFKVESDFETSLFSSQELETINSIIQRFHEVSTWDIVDLSHKEKAWKELESTKQLIGYQNYAFELTTI
jgi:uncharacterized phage-associated protein